LKISVICFATDIIKYQSKTGRHDIAEILLKVALNTKKIIYIHKCVGPIVCIMFPKKCLQITTRESTYIFSFDDTILIKLDKN
jgi:hypothetical protein